MHHDDVCSLWPDVTHLLYQQKRKGHSKSVLFPRMLESVVPCLPLKCVASIPAFVPSTPPT